MTPRRLYTIGQGILMAMDIVKVAEPEQITDDERFLIASALAYASKTATGQTKVFLDAVASKILKERSATSSPASGA